MNLDAHRRAEGAQSVPTATAQRLRLTAAPPRTLPVQPAALPKPGIGMDDRLWPTAAALLLLAGLACVAPRPAGAQAPPPPPPGSDVVTPAITATDYKQLALGVNQVRALLWGSVVDNHDTRASRARLPFRAHCTVTPTAPRARPQLNSSPPAHS